VLAQQRQADAHEEDIRRFADPIAFDNALVHTLLFNCCHTIVYLLLHGCYTVVTRLLKCYYTVASSPSPVVLLLYYCRTAVTRLLHGCHTLMSSRTEAEASCRDGEEREHTHTHTQRQERRVLMERRVMRQQLKGDAKRGVTTV
jgi:uncharacterized protein YceK